MSSSPRAEDRAPAPTTDASVAEHLLRLVSDPLVVLRPLRDASGALADFEVVAVNESVLRGESFDAAALVGRRASQILPEFVRGETAERNLAALDRGEDLLLHDWVLNNPLRGGRRHYDVRATWVGDEVAASFRDLTDDTEMRARYRMLLESTGDVVLVAGPDGLRWASDSLTALAGWRADDLVGRDFASFVHPDDLAPLHEARRLVAAGERATYRLRMRTADGGYVWVETTVRDVRTSEGEHERVATLHDVTTEVSALERRRALERRYALLAQNANDVVALTDLEGIVTFVSPSITEVLGWRPEDLVGRRDTDFVARGDPELARAWRERALSDPAPLTARLRMRTTGGHPIWMTIRMRAALDEDGVATGVVISGRDSEAEIRAERAFRTVAESIHVRARATSETELLNDLCRVAVETGGYLMAWYGQRVDDAEHTVAKVGMSEGASDFLAAFDVHWGVEQRDVSPTGYAVATGETIVVADVTRDPRWDKIRATTLGHHIGSALFLPVTVDGRVDGALVVYAREVGAFGSNEIELLSVLAEGLGIGLSRLRDRAGFAETSRENRVLTDAIDSSQEGILIIGADRRVSYANEALARAVGRRREEMIGQVPPVLRSTTVFVADESPAQAFDRGDSWRGIYFCESDDGAKVEVEAVVTPIHDARGDVLAFVEIQHDLSATRSLEAALDRDHRDRRAIAGIMRDVRVGGSVFDTAGRLARAALALDTVAGAAVLLADGEGRPRPVGVAGVSLPGFVLNEPVPLADAGSVWAMCATGPATFELADPPPPVRPEAATQWRRAGLTTSALVPISVEERAIGALLLASTDSLAGASWPERIGVFEQMGIFAGTLLAEQARDYAGYERRRAEIRARIDTAAFRPVFQPFVDLGTDEVVGYEALTRFSDGARPDEVFVAAHHVGLGLELEFATARAAVAASAGLPEGVWVSVNFSEPAVHEPEIEALVATAPRPIVIELTEHEKIRDYAGVRRAISRLTGVRLAVDDAGSGFTSLSHIVELAPDIVKLDISIVRGVDQDPVRQAMAAGIAYFALESGTQVVAEGVETEGEANALRSLSLTVGGRPLLGQGYYFGRPEPVSPVDA